MFGMFGMFGMLQCPQALAAPTPNPHPRNLFRRRAEEKPRWRRGFIDRKQYRSFRPCEKSAPLDLGDLVGLGAAGGHDLNRGAFLLPDQRTRQWRGDGNPALLGVGFDFADDLPHRLLLGVFIDQRDCGAEFDGVAGKLRDVDDIGARELVFELGNAAFVMRLLFFRGVIFRVLGKIAMRARLRDMLDNARAILRLAFLQLDLQRCVAAGGHRNLFHHLLYPLSVGATAQAAVRAKRLADQASRLKQSEKLIKFRPREGRFKHRYRRRVPSTLRALCGPLMISFRKNSFARCGPQGLRPDKRGYPGQPPRHLKEWCNTALYARGQPGATSDYRLMPAVPRSC